MRVRGHRYDVILIAALLCGCAAAQAKTFEFKYNTTVSGSTNTTPYADMQDTYLYVRSPDDNFGSTWPISIDAWSGGDTPRQKNILMRFGSLADYLPADFQVAAARVYVTFYQNKNQTNEIHVGVYDLFKPWTEGGATWNSTGSSGWDTSGAMSPGADHGATAMDTLTIPGDATTGDVFSISLDADVVQEWINDHATNHGIIMYSSENIIRGTDWYSNNAPIANRPVLELVEDLGPVIVESTNVTVADTLGVSFGSESNVTYSLQSTPDLVTSNFSDTGAIAFGNGEPMTLFDPTGPSTTKLYRVIRE